MGTRVAQPQTFDLLLEMEVLRLQRIDFEIADAVTRL